MLRGAGEGKEDGLQTTQNAIVTTLGTSFTTVAQDALDAISTILPIALPVLGAVIVVIVGIKIFRRVTGR